MIALKNEFIWTPKLGIQKRSKISFAIFYQISTYITPTFKDLKNILNIKCEQKL